MIGRELKRADVAEAHIDRKKHLDLRCMQVERRLEGLGVAHVQSLIAIFNLRLR